MAQTCQHEGDGQLGYAAGVCAGGFFDRQCPWPVPCDQIDIVHADAVAADHLQVVTAGQHGGRDRLNAGQVTHAAQAETGVARRALAACPALER